MSAERPSVVEPHAGGIAASQYSTEPCGKYYKFGRTLGQGSFATVKLCVCLADNSQWAVKIIDKSALESDDETALQIECDTMIKVNHKNIVR